MTPNTVLVLYIAGIAFAGWTLGDVLTAMGASVPIKLAAGVMLGFGLSRWFNPRFAAYRKGWNR
jgi:hypothetical protein